MVHIKLLSLCFAGNGRLGFVHVSTEHGTWIRELNSVVQNPTKYTLQYRQFISGPEKLCGKCDIIMIYLVEYKINVREVIR